MKERKRQKAELNHARVVLDIDSLKTLTLVFPFWIEDSSVHRRADRIRSVAVLCLLPLPLPDLGRKGNATEK